MTCLKTKKYLPEYIINGKLEADVRSRVATHLEGCENCRKELESLKTLVSQMGDLAGVDAPEDFADRLSDRLGRLGHIYDRRNRPSFFKKMSTFLFVPFRIKVPLEFATATALGMVIFFLVNTPEMRKQVAYDTGVKPLKEEVYSQAPAPEAPLELEQPARKAIEFKRQKADVSKTQMPVGLRVAKKQTQENEIRDKPEWREEMEMDEKKSTKGH